MKRKILSITGTRSDYGLMTPVFRKIAECADLELELIVTGMHLLPEFSSSLALIGKDNFCRTHKANILFGDDSNRSMAQSLGIAVYSFAQILDSVRPDIVLLQGDRGEMLAGAIAAAHMNIPIVHMSGGDYSGTIDDSLRNATSKFAHIHLTTCNHSTERLLSMGEARNRIFEVGEPGVDNIVSTEFIPPETLAKELELDLSRPVIIGSQHPVTTEAPEAPEQIRATLEALKELGIQTVFTYPNSDAGGREMLQVLESYRNESFIRIRPSLGSQGYLSLLKIAAVLVGNSSSGIWEAPSFRTPVVNIGTRQHGRLRACNVIDTGYGKDEIRKAIQTALHDRKFREGLEKCSNPYGDGNAAPRTIRILRTLRLVAPLVSKWLPFDEKFTDGE